jgi:L-lactate permease
MAIWMKHDPIAHKFAVFYALTLYNLKEYEKSIETLIKKMIEVTDDKGIKKYSQALTLE